MKNKFFCGVSIFTFIIFALTPINAVTFSYDTSISATRTSGYSLASDNKRCSIRMYSTFLKTDYKTTQTVEDYASDVYPIVSRDLPSNGVYFTMVKETYCRC